MKITQIYDEPLAQAGYIVSDGGEAAVIDPGRDMTPYIEQAKQDGSIIKAVILTHPHADFVSSHQDIARRTGAQIHMSKLVKPDYEIVSFDEGDTISIGQATLRAINTPGHSPDSISIVARDGDGKDRAVFTGDTLFVGDVGRPDLRESVGAQTAEREALARDMYHSTREKLMHLEDDVIVYPAHGAGTLCGKNLSDERSSTIGKEKASNYALSEMDEDTFVTYLTNDQPFIPVYFGYDVELNRKQALPEPEETIKRLCQTNDISPSDLLIDIRNQEAYKAGHIEGSINIPAGESDKFETWLGSIVDPSEQFILVGQDQSEIEYTMKRLAKIGYEGHVVNYVLIDGQTLVSGPNTPDIETLQNNPNMYTIVDVRKESEVHEQFFESSINIPLHQLRKRSGEIPTDKPIVVHCASGYRAAVGSSILQKYISDVGIFDLGENIKLFSEV